ncbi:MAG: DUF2301 domain-containing membrane protein [Geminocystis sp.]|nr:DUF2301 domain-containing membrane protein [Geminocystis sp.]HIK37853.1 DUF2301 domain-containing membrane protein [Geminocystis sp. M7585_C2015_104]MCS7146953.1 DUF2301 domain-containing membrane protein [Geminocystis sp.]MCX8077265.1 DUF2301 domain-containing membrane protein [Geminocystis sp.]MDW8115777.1 DUF2301 domain-containing membrane protein [Geminocystis sp.]
MSPQSPVYQGQFGPYQITSADKLEVIVYRLGLTLTGLSFSLGSILFLWRGLNTATELALTLLFFLFILGLGICLETIHIYLQTLRSILRIAWMVGLSFTLFFLLTSDYNLVEYVANHPPCLLGIGFVFVSLTGIFIKEAFCFNRLEAKILSFVVPVTILSYITGILTPKFGGFLLTVWSFLFLIFILRKYSQDIPSDIGDKSVFEYLAKQRELKKQKRAIN